MPLNQRLRAWILATWYRASTKLCGLVIEVVGTRAADGTTLFVSNHASYLDIPVIGAHLNATFVAKREVAGWPVFGFLARIARTVFIERTRSGITAQSRLLRRRMRHGESLVLFPEGTSTDGQSVLRFKSALFTVVDPREGGLDIDVQPVSISYPALDDGLPLNGPRTALYAWYGDASLVPHLWRVLGLPGARVRLQFHPPVRAADFASRKDLARHCETAVRDGVEAAHREALEAIVGRGVISEARP